MSDFTPLREAIDTLATRAPSPDFGELERRATRRGRRRVTMVAVAAVAAIVVGATVATGVLDGVDRVGPVVDPTTRSPEPSPAPASPTTSSGPPTAPEESFVGERYRTLRETLEVSGWTVRDTAAGKPEALIRCAGNWMDGPGGRSAGHNLGLTVNPEEPPVGWAEEIDGFTSPASASAAAALLLTNLTSCTIESWRSQPIGQTGAALAINDSGVLWVHKDDQSVATLYVATPDGPPPLAVQVDVADLIYSWFG
jgi:hypothetical protein